LKFYVKFPGKLPDELSSTLLHLNE